MSERYRVEVGDSGCEHCGAQKQFEVVWVENGEDVMLGQSYGDSDEAAWMAHELERAYQAGMDAKDAEHARFVQDVRKLVNRLDKMEMMLKTLTEKDNVPYVEVAWAEPLAHVKAELMSK